MSSYYSIVRYVPNPVADERINIGVIAYSGESVAVRFTDNWRRAQVFGSRQIDFLRTFAEDLSASLADQGDLFRGGQGINPQTIERLAARWKNTIQLSEPRGSILNLQDLLDEAARRFLSDRAKGKRGFRDKRAAAAVGYMAIDKALKHSLRMPTAAVLRRDWLVAGKFDGHVFDIVVANGHPLLAAQGLSFETPAISDLRRDIDATAWVVDDVQNMVGGPRVAVVALAAKTSVGETLYGKAQTLFRNLGADFVPGNEADRWAEQTVVNLAPGADTA